MKKKLVMIVFLMAALNACTSSKKVPVSSSTLFKQIGGIQIIDRLTKKLVKRLMRDEKIGFLFKHAVVEDFQLLLSAQICVETGGGCEYRGLTMNDAHSGMAINTREFDIFVAILIEIMTDVGISYPHQNKLLALFTPMRKDIIYK